MTKYLEDNFNRAWTSGGLGWTSDGTQGWISYTLAERINEQGEAAFDSNPTPWSTAFVTLPVSNYVIDIDMPVYGLSADPGVVVRRIDDDNLFFVYLGGATGNKYAILKKKGGNYTYPLISTLTPQAEDHIQVIVESGTIELLVNGVSLGVVTDSDFNTGTTMGFISAGYNDFTTFDNLLVHDGLETPPPNVKLKVTKEYEQALPFGTPGAQNTSAQTAMWFDAESDFYFRLPDGAWLEGDTFLWFKCKPTIRGEMYMDTWPSELAGPSPSTDTVLEVYLGDDLDAYGDPVYYDDDGSPSGEGQSQIIIPANVSESGLGEVVYYWRVGLLQEDNTRQIGLYYNKSVETLYAEGDNEFFPLQLSGLPDTLSLDMTEYTLDPQENVPVGVVKTLWISYEPSGDGTEFRFQSDTPLTSIRIWDKLGNIVSETQGPVDLTLPIDAYIFQIGHYEGQSPEVELTFTGFNPPPYNDFESPYDLAYDYGGEFLDMTESTMTEDEPNYVEGSGSIWASWNAEEDVTVSFVVEGGPSTVPFTVTVFDNDLLTPIHTSSGTGALKFEVDIQDGHDYWMQFVVADPTDFGVELSWLLAGDLVEPAEAVNYIRAEVYEPDGVTMIAEVARRSGVTGQEPLNVAGAGSISVNLDDEIFENHPNLFAWGNIVKFWLGTLCIHGFRIKTRSTTFVSTDEWKGYVRTVGGPSVQHLFDDFMVQHNLVLQNRRLDTRAFTWYAPEGAWYDPLDWVTNYNTNSQDDPPGPQNIPPNKRPKWRNPPKFPDENAKWMWVSPLAERNEGGFQPPPLMGQRYFRKEFSLKKRTLVKMYASSDEKYKVYLDGEEVLTGDGEETGFTEMQSRKLTLTPGRHIIAIRGAQFSQEEIYEKRDVPKPEKPDNTEDARDVDGDGIINEGTPQEGPAPAKEETEEPETIKVRLDDGVDAILFTMMRLDERGKPTSTVIRSNGNWLTTYERPVPAWNRANVLRRVVNEAQDRGNEAAEMLTFGFDNERDSMNRRWKDRWNAEVGIGTSVLELQSLLSEGNNFDVWVRPSDLVIRAWRRRGRDLSKSITLEPGRNLLDWSVEETEEVKNDYLVQYDGGWFKWRHKNSAERYGARESFITMGRHKSDKDAARVLQRAARGVTSAIKRAGTDDFKTLAEDQPSGSIIAVTGARPFLDFGVGDVIKAPNENGVLKRHRVLSLSFMEDDNSYLTYDAELEEI